MIDIEVCKLSYERLFYFTNLDELFIVDCSKLLGEHLGYYGALSSYTVSLSWKS